MANKEQIKELEELLYKKFREAEYEAVKEFAEKLKETLIVNNEENTEIFDYQYTLETIDELLKEYRDERDCKVSL